MVLLRDSRTITAGVAFLSLVAAGRGAEPSTPARSTTYGYHQTAWRPWPGTAPVSQAAYVPAYVPAASAAVTTASYATPVRPTTSLPMQPTPTAPAVLASHVEPEPFAPSQTLALPNTKPVGEPIVFHPVSSSRSSAARDSGALPVIEVTAAPLPPPVQPAPVIQPGNAVIDWVPVRQPKSPYNTRGPSGQQ
jgi:hypothetical protein